jgi:hypothetical protein
MSGRLEELIEKQVNEAALALVSARKYNNLDKGATRTVTALILMNDRLLQIVQNLQNEIEELKNERAKN